MFGIEYNKPHKWHRNITSNVANALEKILQLSPVIQYVKRTIADNLHQHVYKGLLIKLNFSAPKPFLNMYKTRNCIK